MDGGRPNQRFRTRKALLDAAAGLMRDGVKPSLEEVAEAALVSRATAYRYFPNMEALLAEAALHVAVRPPEALFGPDAPSDPAARVEMADAMFDDLIAANEPAMRLMLAGTLTVAAEGAPARQNRRTPLIEAALAPAAAELDPQALRRLVPALGLLIGTEGYIAARDVLQLSDAEALAVKRWAIRALIDAARVAP